MSPWCSQQARSPVCGEAAPSPARAHADSQLHVWEVNPDSFWVQPPDFPAHDRRAPASAERHVGQGSALQPRNGIWRH